MAAAGGPNWLNDVVGATNPPAFIALIKTADLTVCHPPLVDRAASIFFYETTHLFYAHRPM